MEQRFGDLGHLGHVLLSQFLLVAKEGALQAH